MLVLSFSGFADDILNVALNPYPIFFNGQQFPVEGYNINGFTYLKLADLDRLHNTTTSFNQTEQRIDINNKPIDSVDVEEPIEVTTPERQTTPDGIGVLVINGVECISPIEIRDRYWISSERSYQIDLSPGQINNNGNMGFYLFEPKAITPNPAAPEIKKDRFTPLIGKMPFIEVNAEIRTHSSKYYIPADYYINTILPLIDIEPLY